MTILLLLALATATPVPPAPEDLGALVELVKLGLEAARGSKTEVAVGFAIMVAVWIARKVAPARVPRRYLATTILGLTALGGFGGALAAGFPPLDSALTTLVLGAAAVGFWEGAFKHVAEHWDL